MLGCIGSSVSRHAVLVLGTRDELLGRPRGTSSKVMRKTGHVSVAPVSLKGHSDLVYSILHRGGHLDKLHAFGGARPEVPKLGSSGTPLLDFRG